MGPRHRAQGIHTQEEASGHRRRHAGHPSWCCPRGAGTGDDDPFDLFYGTSLEFSFGVSLDNGDNLGTSNLLPRGLLGHGSAHGSCRSARTTSAAGRRSWERSPVRHAAADKSADHPQPHPRWKGLGSSLWHPMHCVEQGAEQPEEPSAGSPKRSCWRCTGFVHGQGNSLVHCMQCFLHFGESSVQPTLGVWANPRHPQESQDPLLCSSHVRLGDPLQKAYCNPHQHVSLEAVDPKVHSRS